MSFREKSAWITLITMLVCFGVYYGALLSGLVSSNSWATFHLGVVCILALVALQIGTTFTAALLSPKDARTPRDERERMIHARSHTIGYYVLMVGMAGVLISTHVPGHGSDVVISTVNFGVAAMVVSALAVAIAQIVMFRRGQ